MAALASAVGGGSRVGAGPGPGPIPGFVTGPASAVCGERCVDEWLARTGNERGYVMDLATLWRFASRWYEGRLERGYVRREPSVAQDYLRSVGLVHPFWGTA